jgi:serine protease Do
MMTFASSTSTIRLRITALLFASALCAPAIAQEVESHGSDLISAGLDDRSIGRHIEAEGGALIESREFKSTVELLEASGSIATLTLQHPRTEPIAPADLYEHASRGVLVVRHIFKCDHCPRWHTLSGGTAFVISAEGVCVTNRHMFEQKHDDHRTYVMVMTSDGAVFGVEQVLANDAPADIAIFKLSKGRFESREIDFSETRAIALSLAHSSRVGESVSLIAHPENSCYTLTTGVISRRAVTHRGINSDVDTEELVPAIEVTCEYGVGSSGGPVMDRRMNVVGMVCNTSTVYSGKGRDKEPQMVRRRCIPSERVLSLIAQGQPQDNRK